MTTIKNDFLLCPVSLSPFTYPKVLPCGHTIDQQSLTKLIIFECPLCKKKFSHKSIDHLPTNWLIVNIMDLSIKQPLGDTKFLTRLKASELAISYLNPILEKELSKLLDDISSLAITGICRYTIIYEKRFITYNKDIQKYLTDLIKVKLITLGYSVRNKIFIIWFKNYNGMIIEW